MLRAMKHGAWPIVVLGWSLLAGAGCAYGEVRQVIRAQFASETHCSEVQLKRRDTWYAYDGPDQYKVIGCGQVRTYTCPASGLVSYDKPACTWVNGDADAPVVQKVEDEEGAADEPSAAPGPAPAAPGKKPAAPNGAKPKAAAPAEPEPQPEL